MTTFDFLQAIAVLSGVLFVVASMLAMGLSLTIPQIVEPLRNGRLVLLALLANFVLVPLLAYLVTLVIPLAQPLRVGLIILATAAGAPFLPKLVQGAKGNIAFGVGLMVLLMVVTVVYMPLVLPLLLQGVRIHPWDIAQSLIGLMLIPLTLGLMLRARSPVRAARYQPAMNKISSLAMLVLLVVAVGLNISNILGLFGTGGILALILMILGSLLIGYFLGGRDPGTRSVLALGTAQRNVSAAIVVAGQNFPGSDTLIFVLVAGIVLLLILLPAALSLGARAGAATRP